MEKSPLYNQNEVMDCGPACLRMISKYYGHHYSLQTLRQKCSYYQLNTLNFRLISLLLSPSRPLAWGVQNP